MIRSLSSAGQAESPLRPLGRAEFLPGLAVAGARLRFEARVFGAFRQRPRILCGEADVGSLSAERAARGEDIRAVLSFVPRFRLQIPVIVAVNGVCAGSGLHFVADADIVIALANMVAVTHRPQFVSPDAPLDT